MIVLAIDTAGREGSVALARSGLDSFEVLGLAPLAGGMYSAQLIPRIASLLEAAGVAKGAIDLLAVNSGPGSFTGLRVGLSTVKGLAESLHKPIVAVSGLEAVAIAALTSEARSSERVIAALDAQRKEVYVGEYEVRSEPQGGADPQAPVMEGVRFRTECARERLVPLAEFIAEMARRTSSALICTPDAGVESALRAAGVAAEPVARPQADLIARIGLARYGDGATISPETLDANYIRRSDAEIFSASTPSPHSSAPGSGAPGEIPAGRSDAKIVRAEVVQDIPRLIALERQADSAAHWGEQHYQAIFAGTPGDAASKNNGCLADVEHAGSDANAPRRICLVVEAASESPACAGESRPAAPQSLVVGFVVAQSAGEEWEIENLVIDAGRRRHGLASRLLEQLLCHALGQGAKTIALEVRESNHAARALYAKWGFREAGRRRSYYRDPEEAAILLTFSGIGSLVKSG